MPFKQLPKTDLCGIIHKQFQLRPHGQAVKTPPSHGGNWGSIPHGATKKTHDDFVVCFLFYIRPCISYCPASRYSCTAGRGVFIACKPLFLHGGAWCFFIARKPCILARRGVVFLLHASRYSCTAGRGVFIARKPCILAWRGAVFLLHVSRYSCTAGRGVFYCAQAMYSCTAGRDVFLLHASCGAFCMARCVVVIERQIEFFTASCTFFIGILHCTASLAFTLWKNTRLRKI